MPAELARDIELERVRTLARVLDNYYIDPLIGLVLPGAGDLIGSLLGLYTVVIAIRRGVSPVIIARMIMNLGFDAAIGFIPLIGDLGDFAFKANSKNVELLSARESGKASAKDWAIVVGVAAAYIALMTFVIWGVLTIVHTIF